MNWKLLAVLAPTLLSATGSVAHEAGSDLEKLQGTWRAIGIETKGKKVPPEIVAKNIVTITIDGTKYTEKLNGEIAEQGTLKVHADKGPRHIDILIGSGRDKGKTQRALYKLEGNTLTIALSPPDSAERPGSFTTQADSHFDVQTFQREKK